MTIVELLFWNGEESNRGEEMKKRPVHLAAARQKLCRLQQWTSPLSVTKNS